MTMKTRKILALAAVAATALALGACTVGRFAYNNASPVVTYMVDDYFDLSGNQEGWVRTRFERLQDWHRTHELPAYQADLRDAVARTERPLTLEDARWVNKTLRAYYKRMVDQALPDMADLLMQLEADQAQHFEQRFAKESAKIEKENKGDAAEREKKRAEKLIDQVETYTGRLDDHQRDLVRGRVHFMTDVSQMRLADRQRRQHIVAELVRSKPSKPEMVAGLRKVLIDTDSWRSPEYTKAIAKRDEEVAEMMVQLAATWSPDQREHVQKKLRGYLNDVSALIATR
ncbi:hypothetical protein DSM104443_02919 [Usitatibacter rugosus]|uniref:Lipoprotein n=2 Tax=Usitatibacter rugosus TaxID=2732067 RepID=A0A6M4GX46_9PROT|nr:hypothetical protein DSM104443_02919 [Usitatibacter rugosus]